ncbi:F0F1 ATP synthase subunit delta [Niallia sp. Krafla_26]|uniref:F0F1 ATP synthase subunit delta n=1 Tax=Niallia sp. Krafla_26 TaxID=3064703 RepID=UPI003D17D7AB
MSSPAIANRYAFALFQVAKEQKLLDQLEDELRVVREVFNQNKDFNTLLSSPKLSKDKKKQLFQNVFSKANPFLQNTFKLLVDRGREGLIAQIADHFIGLADSEKGIAEATVTSTRPLTEEETKALSVAFAKKLNKKDLRIENKVDSNLLGGIKLRIGNRIYDGSLKGKLERLERQLLR